MEGIPGRNSKISKGVADLTCSVASHTDVKFSVFPLGRNKTYRLNKGKKKKKKNHTGFSFGQTEVRV